MSIVLGANKEGLRLKEVVKQFLTEENFDVIDVSDETKDFVDITLAVASNAVVIGFNVRMELDHLWLLLRFKEWLLRKSQMNAQLT